MGLETYFETSLSPFSGEYHFIVPGVLEKRSPPLPFHIIYSLSHVRLFCEPKDYSPPGFSVHGISQARALEWVAISFSRGSS